MGTGEYTNNLLVTHEHGSTFLTLQELTAQQVSQELDVNIQEQRLFQKRTVVSPRLYFSNIPETKYFSFPQTVCTERKASKQAQMKELLVNYRSNALDFYIQQQSNFSFPAFEERYIDRHHKTLTRNKLSPHFKRYEFNNAVHDVERFIDKHLIIDGMIDAKQVLAEELKKEEPNQDDVYETLRIIGKISTQPVDWEQHRRVPRVLIRERDCTIEKHLYSLGDFELKAPVIIRAGRLGKLLNIHPN